MQTTLDRQRFRQLDLAALAITPVTILVQGHNFGIGYQEITIAAIRRALDPSYLINDWFLSTPPHHPALLAVLAFFARFFAEPLLFLMLQFATRLLLLMGTWRLVEALFHRSGERATIDGGWPWIALAAMVGTVLEPRFRLGAHYLQGGHWEPGFTGMALAVWIMALAIRAGAGRGEWLKLGLAGGAGIFFHLFINLPVFGVSILAAAVVARQWKGPLMACAVAFLIGSPSLVPAVLGFFSPGEAPLSNSEVIGILQYRHPHHHLPETWPVSHHAMAALLFAGGIASVVGLKRFISPGRFLIPGALFVYFIMSCLLFWIGSVYQVIPALTYAQPFRLLSLFILVMQIILIASIYRIVGHQPALAFVGLLALRMTGLFGPVVVGVLLLAASVWKKEYPSPRDLPLPGRAALLVILIVSLGGMVLLQTVAPIRALANRFRSQHWLVSVASNDTKRAALTEWIRENTDADDLFAMPPDMVNFRVWEERAVVADFKNVPYTNKDLAEWRDRMEALTGQRAMIERNGGELGLPDFSGATPERLLDAARQYHADYVVFEGTHPDDLYPGEPFAVVRVVPRDDE